MNISFHTFEPSLFGDTKMAAKTGGSLWIPTLLNYLGSRGHDVRFPFLDRDQMPPSVASFITDAQIESIKPTRIELIKTRADLLKLTEVGLFYWRWPMLDRPERHFTYMMQQFIISLYEENKIPYIVFDGDHMLTNDDAKRLISGFGRIAAPELQPIRPYVRSLMYPNVDTDHDYWGDQRDNTVVYVGNDYGRRQQTIDFLNPLSERYEVKVFGNWGTTEPQHKANKTDMPNVKFMGPLDGSLVIPELAKAKWTVHLMKPSYMDVGFCTFRWVEACLAGVPAFVPKRFPFAYDPDLISVKEKFGFAENGKEALLIPESDRSRIFGHQQMFVDQFFDSLSWEEALFDCKRDKWL